MFCNHIVILLQIEKKRKQTNKVSQVSLNSNFQILNNKKLLKFIQKNN